MYRRMMFLSIAVLLMVSGCSEAEKRLLASSDRAVLTLTRESPPLSLTLTNTEDIQMLVRLLSGRPAPFYKCGYTGKIEFFCGDRSLLPEGVSFNTYPGCQHLVFSYQGHLYSRYITKEGRAFLEQILAGLSSSR